MSTLKVYKVDQGYIGKLDISDLKTIESNTNMKFIVILDQSGSMGNAVPNTVNYILPLILEKLNMSNSEVELITFSNSSTRFSGDSDFYRNLKIRCGGCTYMEYAVNNLEKVLKEYQLENKKYNIRLLSFSDGCLHDQERTLKSASMLCNEIKNQFTINSQAIRYFTSHMEPDTRGLSSMLQYNTINEPRLIDIKFSNDFENIAETIVDLFKNDGLNYNTTLYASESVFKENPWNDASSSLDLIKGENVFWLEKIPEKMTIKSMKHSDLNDEDDIVNIEVKVEMGDEVTIKNYKEILDKKINYFMKKLKVLKIVNTLPSIAEMNLIIRYFETFEDNLWLQNVEMKDIDKINISSRMNRLKKLIQKRNISLVTKMKEIRNDDRVNQLNSKQLADFLRNVDTGKDSKSLSKRGLGNGIEFDDIARKEVLAMSEHLDEIKDIDDSNHSRSFYSTSTTLEGIKTVCELAEDKEVLENVSAIEIIKLLNIVGIGCDSPIRNYTDPMIYQLNEIFLGCYVSLSDVLATTEYNNGKNALVDFNTKKIIVNVIPVFEDQRIHKFLLKYAPKLLEYTTSIGMRRVLVDIPYTYEYLFQSAISKLCQDFSTKKSEAAIQLFANLIESYELASGDHFNYLTETIIRQMDAYAENNELSKYHIFLNDSTIDNMTKIFIKLIKENKTSIFPKLLRHLFCHEVHRAVNKLIKNHNHNEEFVQSYIQELLGIDYEKNKTCIPELFQYDENPKFYEDYTLNEDKLNEFYGLKESTEKDTAYRTNFIPFIPSCLEAILSSDKITAIKNLEEFNDINMKKALGITYDLSYFRLFAIIQAFLYRKKDERMNDSEKVMKIIDIGDFNEANKMVKEKVRQFYQSSYDKEIAIKNKKEIEIFEDELVESMLSCEHYDEYIDYFTNGISRGDKTVKIENTYSPALSKLISKIVNYYDDDDDDDSKDGDGKDDSNEDEEFPLIDDKIAIILLGRDKNDKEVWNNGNIYYGNNRIELGDILEEYYSYSWEIVKMELDRRRIHIYRNLPNRHGHSNDLPSYWSLGYNSLYEMFSSVSQEMINDYKSKHIGCCGLK